MTAVSLRQVVRRYDRTRVLDGVDLEVPPGQRVAVLGHNGAGKTTLLRLVAGLLRPDSGAVRVAGADPTLPAARRRIGVLGHAPALYSNLTAAENVRFWSGLHGVGPGEGLGMLAGLGIDPSDDRRVSAFSQGMRKRVGLACALAHRPSVLVLDEPYAGLDAEGVEAMTRLLLGSPGAVLMATHEPERASSVCDRVVELAAGLVREA
ncbi:MAG TPA: heme ABC exporter ATP-binding protein CcmA [Actinomycetota bacterium]|nr:heme ABC exporter ATP-binding protein CcmA [Actinomycetota bacterium]